LDIEVDPQRCGLGSCQSDFALQAILLEKLLGVVKWKGVMKIQKKIKNLNFEDRPHDLTTPRKG
jgi:hypothetical protein